MRGREQWESDFHYGFSLNGAHLDVIHGSFSPVKEREREREIEGGREDLFSAKYLSTRRLLRGIEENDYISPPKMTFTRVL